MGLKSEARVKSPEDVEVTLEITMTVRSWRRLKEHIESQPGWTSFPMLALVDRMRELVRLVEERFDLSEPEDGDGQ